MAFRNRTGRQQTVPAEPLVPYIELERVGAIRWVAKLTPHEKYGYTTWLGNRWSKYECQWYIFGDRERANKVAKKILNRYLRRVSYRNGSAVRITGKVL